MERSSSYVRTNSEGAKEKCEKRILQREVTVNLVVSVCVCARERLFECMLFIHLHILLLLL